MFHCWLFPSKLVPTASPENLTVVVLDSRSLRLSWNPLAAEHQNGDVLGYRITITAVETGTASQYNSTSTSLTISELHPYYTYQCKVAAFNSAGVGPFTTVVEKMTDQDGMYVSNSHALWNSSTNIVGIFVEKYFGECPIFMPKWNFNGNFYAFGNRNKFLSFLFQLLLASHKMAVPQWSLLAQFISHGALYFLEREME